MDQPQLGFEPEEVPVQRRRRRRAARGPKRRQRKLSANVALVLTPQVRTCGFCGHRQTVLGEMGVCDGCGGIMSRAERAEDDWIDTADDPT